MKGSHMPTNENRVKNAVAGYIAGNGYASQLQIRAENERGPDIYAEHRNNASQRIFVEAKGDSPGGNRTLSIQSAWGELISRITTLNANRIHGLAFPLSWENNVARLTSHVVAKELNVHYFFVSNTGHVTEYTAAQFERRAPRIRRRRRQ